VVIVVYTKCTDIMSYDKNDFLQNRQNQCPVNVQNNDDAEVEYGVRFVWNEERIYICVFSLSLVTKTHVLNRLVAADPGIYTGIKRSKLRRCKSGQ